MIGARALMLVTQVSVREPKNPVTERIRPSSSSTTKSVPSRAVLPSAAAMAQAKRSIFAWASTALRRSIVASGKRSW
jgi:hypothetical protein